MTPRASEPRPGTPWPASAPVGGATAANPWTGGAGASLPPAFTLSTDLVRHIAQVPLSYVSLVADDCPHVMAEPPPDMETAPLPADAMDQIAFFEARPVLIEDLRTHPRFRDHPLVAGSPHYAFWAAFPLITDEGFVLGTLCALDLQPRKLSGEQVGLIRRIAGQLTEVLKAQSQQRERWSQRMERLLGALQRQAGVEDINTAVCFLRFCAGAPPSQRDGILLPAADLADFDMDGRMVLTALGRRLMTDHGLPQAMAPMKATLLRPEDVLNDTLAALAE